MNRPSPRQWLFAFLLATSVLAQAQNRPPASAVAGPNNQEQKGPGSSSCRPPGPPMEELTTVLGLQANQRDALAALLKERHEAMKKIHEQGQENDDATKAQSNAKIAKVLSPEQMSKFQQWEKTHRPPPPPLRSDSKNTGAQQGGMPGRGPGENQRPDKNACPPPPPRDGDSMGARP
jgi:Spy/CpxP family protein refolding chaperone